MHFTGLLNASMCIIVQSKVASLFSWTHFILETALHWLPCFTLFLERWSIYVIHPLSGTGPPIIQDFLLKMMDKWPIAKLSVVLNKNKIENHSISDVNGWLMPTIVIFPWLIFLLHKPNYYIYRFQLEIPARLD